MTAESATRRAADGAAARVELGVEEWTGVVAGVARLERAGGCAYA
mgnify:CR=1 FL=1